MIIKSSLNLNSGPTGIYLSNVRRLCAALFYIKAINGKRFAYKGINIVLERNHQHVHEEFQDQLTTVFFDSLSQNLTRTIDVKVRERFCQKSCTLKDTQRNNQRGSCVDLRIIKLKLRQIYCLDKLLEYQQY